ncbi:MAG: hypothetical protein K2J39_07130 [Ruminococcus sp.]|nr:hypothetical protein [Ruminococcus sp.]
MNEYEEIQRWLDYEADNYVSTEELLKQYGLDMKNASEQADIYKEKFFTFLRKYKISCDNINVITAQIDRLSCNKQNEEVLFLYTALVTEKGLLFGDIDNEEQKVLLWLEQSEKAEKFSEAIRMEKIYESRLEKLSGFQEIKVSEKTDIEEQTLLYRMILQHGFLYKGRSNLFLENIGELVRKVNSNPELKAIKPYVYSTVLSRKHNLMMKRKNYSPNFANIFEKTVYRINKDNGKNFAMYQSYIELYEQLRRYYEDECDIKFSDYCFSHLSNLSEWYYENCEPNEEIPMTPERMAKQYTGSIQFEIPEDIDDKTSLLEIAYMNILINETDWLDMIKAVQEGADISDYCEKLYQLAGGNKICRNKKLAFQYARLHLNIFMEEINRRILMNVYKNFLPE